VIARPSATPARRRFLWIFSALMVAVAGSAFVFKLIEFIFTATTRGPDALASFLIPVLNYLLVAVGFLCLFLRAWFCGQFRDVEATGKRMLQLQERFDRECSTSSTRS
jgi:uncharacterized membrane protein